jgi:hypothetical protein
VYSRLSAKKYALQNIKKALIKSWSKQLQAAANEAPVQLHQTKIDRSWLRELGIDGANTQSTMDELVGLAYNELERQVGYILAHELTDNQLDAFEVINDSQGDDAASAWLEQTLPHYRQVVHDQHEKLSNEVERAEDKEAVITGWGRVRNK